MSLFLVLACDSNYFCAAHLNNLRWNPPKLHGGIPTRSGRAVKFLSPGSFQNSLEVPLCDATTWVKNKPNQNVTCRLCQSDYLLPMAQNGVLSTSQKHIKPQGLNIFILVDPSINCHRTKAPYSPPYSHKYLIYTQIYNSCWIRWKKTNWLVLTWHNGNSAFSLSKWEDYDYEIM